VLNLGRIYIQKYIPSSVIHLQAGYTFALHCYTLGYTFQRPVIHFQHTFQGLEKIFSCSVIHSVIHLLNQQNRLYISKCITRVCNNQIYIRLYISTTQKYLFFGYTFQQLSVYTFEYNFGYTFANLSYSLKYNFGYTFANLSYTFKYIKSFQLKPFIIILN
jgi:hypothetical protein